MIMFGVLSSSPGLAGWAIVGAFHQRAVDPSDFSRGGGRVVGAARRARRGRGSARRIEQHAGDAVVSLEASCC